MGGLTVTKIFNTKEEADKEIARVLALPPFGLFHEWTHTEVNENGQIEVTMRWTN